MTYAPDYPAEDFPPEPPPEAYDYEPPDECVSGRAAGGVRL